VRLELTLPLLEPLRLLRDGNAYIFLLERWERHSHRHRSFPRCGRSPAVFLQCVFVFRENLSEAVGLVDLLGSVQWDLPFSNITGEEPGRRLDICAISSSEGICRAIATLSPVTIFTFTP
jgi:hypothetical protein